MKQMNHAAKQILAFVMAVALVLQFNIPTTVLAAGPDAEEEYEAAEEAVEAEPEAEFLIGPEVSEDEAEEETEQEIVSKGETEAELETKLPAEEEPEESAEEATEQEEKKSSDGKSGIVGDMVYGNGSSSSQTLSVTDASDVTYTVTYQQTMARSMLAMVNEFRQSDDAWYWNPDNVTKTELQGKLSDYTYNYDLENIAMQRAAELAIYFSHTRPSGQLWSSAFTEYKQDHATFVYSYSGESIAAGQTTAEAALTTWEEADENYSGQDHRRALLSEDFNSIGIACVKYNGTCYWVQEFAYITNTSTETSANDSDTTVTAKVAASNATDQALSADPENYELAVGDTAEGPVVSGTFKTTDIWPTRASCNASQITADWSVGNTSVATFSDGILTAVSTGTTELTTTVLGQDISIPITVQQSIAGCTITVDPESCVYDGDEQEPAVTVKDDDKELTEGEDYTVSYSDNINVGTATVTITGIGLYGGSGTATFEITKANIADTCTATLTPDSYEYDGSAKEPEVTVTNKTSGIVLTKDTDYKVAYSDNINIGTATVTIEGQGNYTGTLEETFTIAAINISTSGYTITLSGDSFVYDGTEKTPNVTVSNGSSTLTVDDYDVIYTDNVNAGTATVTVTGKGNCNGTITTTFTIEKREVIPSISGITTKVYDGTADAPDGLEIVLSNVVDGDDVTATAESYEYNSADVAGATEITATGITLSGDDADNYKLSADSVSTSGTITKAEAVIKFVSGYSLDKTYNGTAVSNPTADDLELTGATYDDIIFEWYEGSTASGDTISAPTDAGTYTLVARVAESSNYTAAQATLTVTISKASYSPEELSKTVLAEHASTDVSVDISDLIKDGGTVGTPTADGELIASGSLTVTDGAISFGTTAQEEGTTATITIPVTGSTNYGDYEITITVTAEPITVSVEGHVLGYTGVEIEDAVITVTIKDGTGTFEEDLTGEWITNLPAGLSQYNVKVNDTTVEIHISGTPEEEFEDAPFAVTIPAGNIVGLDDDLEESGGDIEIDEATYTLECTDVSGEFAELTYGYEEGSSVTYTLTNAGNQTVTGIEVNAGDDFTAVASADSVEPGETITVTVTSNTGLNAGNNEARLTITWDNAENDLIENLSQVVLQAENTGSAVSITKTYDGKPASIEIKADFGEETAEYTWYDEDGNELSEAPKDVGSYKVEISIPETINYTGVDVTAEYVIEKATPTIVLGDKTEYYTGSPLSMDDAKVILVNGEDYDGEITYTYYADEGCTQELDGAPSEIGIYYVVASIEASGNYTAAQSEAAKLSIVEKPAETRNISGIKHWDDDDDKADARPDSITVNLYQNGSEKPYVSKTVTAADDWAWSFTVPMYDEDGNAFAYTIDEDKVAYYTPSYKSGSFDITNTFVGEEGAETTTSGPSKGGDNPKTGDTNNYGIWLALLAAGAAGVIGISRKRKMG